MMRPISGPSHDIGVDIACDVHVDVDVDVDVVQVHAMYGLRSRRCSGSGAACI